MHPTAFLFVVATFAAARPLESTSNSASLTNDAEVVALTQHNIDAIVDQAWKESFKSKDLSEFEAFDNGSLKWIKKKVVKKVAKLIFKNAAKGAQEKQAEDKSAADPATPDGDDGSDTETGETGDAVSDSGSDDSGPA